MKTKTVAISLFLMIASGLVADAARAGMVRVAKRYSVLDFLGGCSKPVGTFDGIGPTDFDADGVPKQADADDAFDPSFHLALSYGQLRNDHMLYQLGFRYTNIKDVDTITTTDGQRIYYQGVDPVFRQFDLDFNFNYLFMNITKTFLAPYVGVGFRAGMTTVGGEGYSTEAELNIATAVNAGAEVKVWQAPKGRSFVTLASANSYEFYVSGNRPRYLNIGLGLKYYYRM
ncbi:MAG: hypothetical protein ABIE70_01305 [bacterium]